MVGMGYRIYFVFAGFHLFAVENVVDAEREHLVAEGVAVAPSVLGECADQFLPFDGVVGIRDGYVVEVAA